MEPDRFEHSMEEKPAVSSSEKKGFRPVAVAAALIAAAALSCAAGYRLGDKAGFARGHELALNETFMVRTTEISYEHFKELIAANESFFLLVARPTCRFCALVDNYLSFRDNSDLQIPIYFLSLESARGTDFYNEVKADIGIDYVPTFRYYGNGEMLYNLNNPRDRSYFDENATNESRNAVYAQMADKIEAFIAGATGRGEVVNEDVLVAETGSVITAIPVSEVQ